MTTDSRVRYVRAPLYPKQEEALFNPARYGVTEASTKSGKTVASIVWLHEQAALGGAPGRNYWWIAPIRRTARIAFKRLKLFLPRDTFQANETERTITLANGSTLSFLGAENPDSLYGDRGLREGASTAEAGATDSADGRSHRASLEGGHTVLGEAD